MRKYRKATVMVLAVVGAAAMASAASPGSASATLSAAACPPSDALVTSSGDLRFYWSLHWRRAVSLYVCSVKYGRSIRLPNRYLNLALLGGQVQYKETQRAFAMDPSMSLDLKTGPVLRKAAPSALFGNVEDWVLTSNGSMAWVLSVPTGAGSTNPYSREFGNVVYEVDGSGTKQHLAIPGYVRRSMLGLTR